MQVFKFGGASVKDAQGIKNLVRIIKEQGDSNKVLVISAMGKTTNHLEQVLHDYLTKSPNLEQSLNNIEQYHYQIIRELFTDSNHFIYGQIYEIFQGLKRFFLENRSPNKRFVYDQVVSIGEFLSTRIVSAYLTESAIENQWVDVRTLIKTDTNYQEAHILWEQTQQSVQTQLCASMLYVTQGFLGGDPNFFTTTLGREGSDFSAAIIAYCLNAKELTIWKDVQGVLNADPRYFNDTILLQQISYQEAVELAFYGASVIHPKTIQPLKIKHIPLRVRSFLDSQQIGTLIGDGEQIFPKIPCFILKQGQQLLNLSAKDFSFIQEKNLIEIFSVLTEYQIRMHLMQNSAISLSLCLEDKFQNITKAIEILSEHFQIDWVQDVSLYTLRHADDKAIKTIEQGKQILLKQRLQNTLQWVIK